MELEVSFGDSISILFMLKTENADNNTEGKLKQAILGQIWQICVVK